MLQIFAAYLLGTKTGEFDTEQNESGASLRIQLAGNIVKRTRNKVLAAEPWRSRQARRSREENGEKDFEIPPVFGKNGLIERSTRVNQIIVSST